jgi:hypothetical protein
MFQVNKITSSINLFQIKKLHHLLYTKLVLNTVPKCHNSSPPLKSKFYQAVVIFNEFMTLNSDKLCTHTFTLIFCE